MPVRLAVTEGTVADCSQALPLIEGIEAECLLADKAYDTNEIIATVRELGMDPVIPPKSNRREKRDYDRALYKLRHLVENGFLECKQWRGVATRYAKRTASYLAICQTPGSDGLEQTLLTTPPRSDSRNWYWWDSNPKRPWMLWMDQGRSSGVIEYSSTLSS